MTALRSIYEDAVVAAIGSALLAEDLGGVASGYLKTVETYNGPLTPGADDAALLRLKENGTPAIGVTTGDGDYDEIAIRRRKSTLTTTLELILISANPRSHRAHLHGDEIDDDPGIYQMIEDLRALLFGQELDVTGAGYANPASEAAIIRSESMTVWRLTYDVPMDANRLPLSTGADDYLTVRTKVNNADDADADPITTSDRDITP